MTTQPAELPATIARPQRTPHHNEIRNAAQARLLASGYQSVGTLECEVVDGVLVLSGVVSSYYLKQVAQAAVLRLESVYRIRNLVQVES